MTNLKHLDTDFFIILPFFIFREKAKKKMSKRKIREIVNTLFVIIVLSIFFSLFLITANATPEGPNSIVRGDSERKTLDSGGQEQEAEAGNMTSLEISATTITKRWQGFYGNISGGITLDDAANNTMYSWGLITPSGEIYASNGTGVTWANIHCINFTSDESSGIASKYNLTILNHFIGLGSDTEQAEDDSVNATFNQTFGDDDSTLEIGSVTINNADNCSMVYLYNSSGYQTTHFKEVLLTDNESIIFASIIEQDTAGFQNASVDFEMIVGVNGTSTTASTHIREYYFYIELIES